MKMITNGKHKCMRIDPGEYFASNHDIIISTNLGSCVAVCLFDRINRVIGMNHIMISRNTNIDVTACRLIGDGKHGLCGMSLLINDMIELGASLKNLDAKAFGGASMFKPYEECFIQYCVGEGNSRYIKKFLKSNSIPLVSEDLGGDRGREIWFDWKDFSVTVKKFHKRSNLRLNRKDKAGWQKLSLNTGIASKH